MKHLYLSAIALLGISAVAQCVPPVITKAESPAAICSGSKATLTVAADAFEILWYDVATGSKAVGRGNTFTTGAVPLTTSYWAEARNRLPGTAAVGAKHAPTGNSSTAIKKEKDAAGLAFSANEDFILNSVDVFLAPGDAATITIQLRDSSNSVIQTATTTTPAISGDTPQKFTIQLNFNISKGKGYNLVVASGTKIIKESKGITFPYALGNVATITGGVHSKGADAKTYYYLYNWSYTPYIYCASERKEVTVTIDPAPPVAKAHDICFSGTVTDLKAEGSNIKWYDSATAGTPLAATTPLKTYTYYVSQTTNCESVRIPVVVTVHSPQPPKAHAQLVCSDAKVRYLQADGVNLKWYQEETGGEAFSSEEQAYNITYYVSQTIGGCESGRTPVEVTLKKEVPHTLGPTPQQFREGETLADFENIIGENINWYDKNFMPLPSSTIIQDRTLYHTTQTIDGCESGFFKYFLEKAEVPYADFQGLKYNSKVSGILSIKNSVPIKYVNVLNLMGNIIAHKTPESTEVELDLTTVPLGRYYLAVSTGRGLTRNFRIEKTKQ